MINLMYVVLMAMLALNISTEVLDGFSIVEESLNRTTANSSKENESLYSNFADQMKTNPQKVKEWFDKATEVKRMSDSLYNFAQQLKVAIVREADGADGDVLNIKGKDNLEAASHVMLAPGTGQGGKLFRAINSFRERILAMVPDATQKAIIASNLTTKVPHKENTLGKNWQEYMFEDMPVAAAVTLLSKLQSDVRYAEGEVLHTLVANIDMKDIRVNKLSAFVIPESRTVISGDLFKAQIVMAAVDTTQQPEIYVGGRRISGSQYQFTAGGVGEHSFGGYITMRDGNGNTIRREFTQKYTVVDHLQAVLFGDGLNGLRVAKIAVDMDRKNGHGFVGNQGLDFGRVHGEMLRLNINIEKRYFFSFSRIYSSYSAISRSPICANP